MKGKKLSPILFAVSHWTAISFILVSSSFSLSLSLDLLIRSSFIVRHCTFYSLLWSLINFLLINLLQTPKTFLKETHFYFMTFSFWVSPLGSIFFHFVLLVISLYIYISIQMNLLIWEPGQQEREKRISSLNNTLLFFISFYWYIFLFIYKGPLSKAWSRLWYGCCDSLDFMPNVVEWNKTQWKRACDMRSLFWTEQAVAGNLAELETVIRCLSNTAFYLALS